MANLQHVNHVGIDFSLVGSELRGILDSSVEINAQTATAYTLVLDDRRKLVTLDNALAIELTLPTNTAAPFPLGTVLALGQLGEGLVTLVAPDVTVNGVLHGTAITSGQYAPFTLTKVGTDSWWLTGDVGAVTEGDPPPAEPSSDSYVLLTATDWVDTPSTVAWNFPAPSEMRIHVAPDAWTGGTYYIVGKSENEGSPTSGYNLRINSTGALRWHSGTIGSVTGTAVFTEADAGVAWWLRVEREAGGRIRIYRSLTEGDWVSIGTNGISADPIPTNAVLPNLFGAGDGNSVGISGKLYRVKAWEGDAETGTLMYDFNPALATAGTPTSVTAAETGEVWTFRGGNHSVVHP